jgi:hypothetical protein
MDAEAEAAPEPEPEPEVREAPPQMTALQHVAFHGDQLSTVKDTQTGHVYCSPREICGNMALDWPGQYTKLTSTEFYLPHIRRWAIPTPGGLQEVLLLDTRALPTWLLSISAERVKLINNAPSKLVRKCLLAAQSSRGAVVRVQCTPPRPAHGR